MDNFYPEICRRKFYFKCVTKTKGVELAITY